MRIISILFLTLCWITAAFSGTTKHSPSLFDDDFDGANRETRLHGLSSIDRGATELNSCIANITPNEQEWLDKEDHDIANITDEKIREDRALKRYDTTLFHKDRAKWYLTNELSLIKKIKISNDANLEIIYWAKLASLILAPNNYDSLKLLEERGYFNNAGCKYRFANQLLLQQFGIEIINKIITPHLQTVNK